MLNIGIDAGGTSIDIAATNGPAERRFSTPGVNVRRDGLETSAQRIAEAVKKAGAALRDDSTSETRIVIGVAGAGDESTCAQLRAAIGRHVGDDARIMVISDADLALFSAHEDRRGAILIIGTGSIALLRDGAGRVFRRGGLGYLLGDEGSGYAIGLAAARYLTRSMDRSEPSELATLLADRLRVTDLPALIHRTYVERLALQSLAQPVVAAAENGDADARQILTSGVEALAGMLASLDTHRQRENGDIDYCVFGGLGDNQFYRTLVCETAVPTAWRIVVPAHPDPATGALSLAGRL
jgi:N-acetylglucosamine kinase-like BadF-type ATPase